jgi:hypothetical protein
MSHLPKQNTSFGNIKLMPLLPSSYGGQHDPEVTALSNNGYNTVKKKRVNNYYFIHN